MAGLEDERDLRGALTNVALYGALQVATLGVLALTYRWRANISGARHLAFVLGRQWDGIQAKLVFWVLYNVQASLEHFGAAKIGRAVVVMARLLTGRSFLEMLDIWYRIRLHARVLVAPGALNTIAKSRWSRIND